MRRLTTMLTALCLACSLVLLGCGATSAGTVIFEETVSPNEEYVSSEADVVYYTVRVTQAAPGTATVSTESNSGFFEPVSYEVSCDGELSADDTLHLRASVTSIKKLSPPSQSPRTSPPPLPCG